MYEYQEFSEILVPTRRRVLGRRQDGTPAGHKQSGRGRLRGLAALDDFLEYKHIVLNPGVVAPREAADSNESERTT